MHLSCPCLLVKARSPISYLCRNNLQLLILPSRPCSESPHKTGQAYQSMNTLNKTDIMQQQIPTKHRNCLYDDNLRVCTSLWRTVRKTTNHHLIHWSSIHNATVPHVPPAAAYASFAACFCATDCFLSCAWPVTFVASGSPLQGALSQRCWKSMKG